MPTLIEFIDYEKEKPITPNSTLKERIFFPINHWNYNVRIPLNYVAENSYDVLKQLSKIVHIHEYNSVQTTKTVTRVPQIIISQIKKVGITISLEEIMKCEYFLKSAENKPTKEYKKRIVEDLLFQIESPFSANRIFNNKTYAQLLTVYGKKTTEEQVEKHKYKPKHTDCGCIPTGGLIPPQRFTMMDGPENEVIEDPF